jgi:hypothetical protein
MDRLGCFGNAQQSAISRTRLEPLRSVPGKKSMGIVDVRALPVLPVQQSPF